MIQCTTGEFVGYFNGDARRLSWVGKRISEGYLPRGVSAVDAGVIAVVAECVALHGGGVIGQPINESIAVRDEVDGAII
jgi:hypothetical protein